MEPQRYGPFPYTPINRRPKITWPDGKRLALWVIPNIETFPLDEPVPGGTGMAPDIINWAPRDYGARVGLLPRDGGAADITWHEVGPCFVFHPMNAYEDSSGRVVLDVVRHSKLFESEQLDVDTPTLTLDRWLVDPKGGPVKETRLDDRPQEFPRHDERLVGKPYRYGYCGTAVGEGLFGGLLKHDLQTGETLHRDEGPERFFQEPVFVPSSYDADEDDGWLMSYVHDAGRGAAEVLILHAQDFLGDPVARIELPVRVPFGFHGNWCPDTA